MKEKMYQIINPPEHLKKYIELFWHFQNDDVGSIPFSFHAIAGTKTELIFFCRGSFVTQSSGGTPEKVLEAGFYGQSTNYGYYSPTVKQANVFGVRLNPITLRALFGLPASEVTNQKVDISTILGSMGDEITDEVLNANSFFDRVNIIVKFVEGRVQRLNQKFFSLENLLQTLQLSNRQYTVDQLVVKAHLSPRQFERHFKELTGFSAKTYLKLTRFELFVQAISASENFTEYDLLNTALDLGYYDHSHLNHHFKSFTGDNPTSYFKKISEQSF